MNKKKLAAIKQYVLERLSEASTWRGITMVVTSCGIAISPEHMETITFVGLLVTGVLGAVSKDSK